MVTSADAFESLDPGIFDGPSRYKFLTAAVVPRPIAQVTTLMENGEVNAAPFSQFIILSSSPAILGFVASKHPDGSKDTQVNIERTRECVIHIVDEPMAKIVQQCAFPFPAGVSEVTELGLETIPSELVATPRLSIAPISFECRLQSTQSFGLYSTLFACEVLRVHLRRGLRDGHRIAHEALHPLGRISGRRYCQTEQTLTMGPDVDVGLTTTPARMPV